MREIAAICRAGTKGIDSTHHALQFKKRAQQLVSNKSMTLGNFTDR